MNETLSVYEPTTLKLTEKSGIPGVLGVVEGPFFFPEVPSRNNRVYPRAAWDNVLNNDRTKRFLEQKLMFGTIGHEDIDPDKLIREGKVSHRTTKLWIDETTGIGMGEAEILDTPVGRMLHTVIQSGSLMSVSSKGEGGYRGRGMNGIQEVDPKSFVVERFDFVVDPGFLEAKPQIREALVESLNQKEKYTFELTKEQKAILESSMNDDSKNTEDEDMKLEEMVQNLTEDKIKLQDTLAKMTEALDEAKAKAAKVDVLTETVESLKTENKGLTAKVTETVAVVEKFNTLGTVEEIETVLEGYEKVTEALKELGTIEELSEALTVLEKYKESIDELGSFEEIAEALDTALEYHNSVSELGTVDEIREALEGTLALVEGINKEKVQKTAEEFASKYSIEVDKALKMLEKMTETEVDAILSDMVEVSKGYNFNKKKEVTEDKDEDKPAFLRSGGSRAAAMMESIGGLKK